MYKGTPQRYLKDRFLALVIKPVQQNTITYQLGMRHALSSYIRSWFDQFSIRCH
jgi:hypothetical protein